MPLVINGAPVRLEGATHIVERVWKRRPEGFVDELSPHQQDKIAAETGRRALMRFPSIVAPLNQQELAKVSKILGEALERQRKERREDERREAGGR
jgi:hypothetical protein